MRRDGRDHGWDRMGWDETVETEDAGEAKERDLRLETRTISYSCFPRHKRAGFAGNIQG